MANIFQAVLSAHHFDNHSEYFSAVTEWLESELSDKNSHISHLISRYENSKLLSDLSLLCQNQEADDIAEVFQNILDQCSKTKQKTILNILNSVE